MSTTITPTHPMPSTTERASVRQVKVILELIRERRAVVDVPDDMTEAVASALINQLLALPKLPGRTTTADPGWYLHKGRLCRVRVSGGGRVYAEELRPGNDDGARTKWTLVPGMAYRLTPDEMIDDADGIARMERIFG